VRREDDIGRADSGDVRFPAYPTEPSVSALAQPPGLTCAHFSSPLCDSLALTYIPSIADDSPTFSLIYPLGYPFRASMLLSPPFSPFFKAFQSLHITRAAGAKDGRNDTCSQRLPNRRQDGDLNGGPNGGLNGDPDADPTASLTATPMVFQLRVSSAKTLTGGVQNELLNELLNMARGKD
jgi:hypothetical protein